MAVNDTQAVWQAGHTRGVTHVRLSHRVPVTTPGAAVVSLTREKNDEPQEGLGTCLKSHSYKLAGLQSKPTSAYHIQ